MQDRIANENLWTKTGEEPVIDHIWRNSTGLYTHWLHCQTADIKWTNRKRLIKEYLEKEIRGRNTEAGGLQLETDGDGEELAKSVKVSQKGSTSTQYNILHTVTSGLLADKHQTNTTTFIVSLFLWLHDVTSITKVQSTRVQMPGLLCAYNIISLCLFIRSLSVTVIYHSTITELW